MSAGHACCECGSFNCKMCLDGSEGAIDSISGLKCTAAGIPLLLAQLQLNFCCRMCHILLSNLTARSTSQCSTTSLHAELR